MADGDIVLGANQYGKAECRVVRIVRDTPVHTITDLNVTSQLRGEFGACFTDGDNSQVIATDTQKNTVYAFAKEHGIASPEQFLLTLADHFVTGYPSVTGGRWEADLYAWQRILANGAPHDHSFVRSGQEVRTAVVQRFGDQTHVLAGLTDLTLLKSTGSEFHSFPRDKYTTLAYTDDRVMATSVTARWRYTDLDIDFNARYEQVKALLLETFAVVHSLALQQTLFQIGRRVLERFPDIAEMRMSCPNKHHFVVDLEPFGLTNPNEVFFAADRPYGLIEATIEREGAPSAPDAWIGVPGFI